MDPVVLGQWEVAKEPWRTVVGMRGSFYGSSTEVRDATATRMYLDLAY